MRGLLLFLFAWLLSESAFKALPQTRDNEYNELVFTIEALQRRLTEEELDGGEAASLWTQLGTLLTFRDVRYHEDGFVTRERALEAFDQALRVAPPEDRRTRLLAHHKRGLLLKMMGRGGEAVRAHEQSLSLATSDSDRSVALQFKATALSMMGEPSAAAALYREALELTPSQLGIYYPLAGCLAEVGQSSEEWRALLREVRERGRAYDAGEVQESFQELLSFEYSSGTSSSQFHWALYVIAEKAGELKEAWRSLRRAHDIQIKTVGLPASYVMENKDRNINIFTKGY